MFDQGDDWGEMTWSTKKTKTVTENTTCFLENCGEEPGPLGGFTGVMASAISNAT